MHGNAISVTVGDRRRNHGTNRRFSDFSDSLQNVAHLSPFDSELVFIVHMLISASTTTSEIRALRFHAMRRRLVNRDEFRFRKLLLFAKDLGRNLFSLDRER